MGFLSLVTRPQKKLIHNFIIRPTQIAQSVVEMMCLLRV